MRSVNVWDMTVKHDYWWPGLGTYVHKYVEGCALCQQMKSDTHPVTPPLVLIPSTVTVPFTFLSVDLITDLPPLGGFNSIMVVVDHGLMKGVIITPCLKTITSEVVAKLVFKHIYQRFGLYDTVAQKCLNVYAFSCICFSVSQGVGI